jgi:hypothetical protein
MDRNSFVLPPGEIADHVCARLAAGRIAAPRVFYDSINDRTLQADVEQFLAPIPEIERPKVKKAPESLGKIPGPNTKRIAALLAC